MSVTESDRWTTGDQLGLHKDGRGALYTRKTNWRNASGASHVHSTHKIMVLYTSCTIAQHTRVLRTLLSLALLPLIFLLLLFYLFIIFLIGFSVLLLCVFLCPLFFFSFLLRSALFLRATYGKEQWRRRPPYSKGWNARGQRRREGEREGSWPHEPEWVQFKLRANRC